MVLMDKHPVELGYPDTKKQQQSWTRKTVMALAGFVTLLEGGGILMGALSRDNDSSVGDDWFDNLVKPWWNPPDWIFGPVWSVLYFMIALSAFRVYRKIGFTKALPWIVFFIQITLNFAWPVIFFKGHRLLGAFIEILILLAFIILNIMAFLPIEKAAGVLLLPYLAWVSFASFLNFTLWRLNPDADNQVTCYWLGENSYFCQTQN